MPRQKWVLQAYFELAELVANEIAERVEIVAYIEVVVSVEFVKQVEIAEQAESAVPRYKFVG